jgi:hypothetical protein
VIGRVKQSRESSSAWLHGLRLYLGSMAIGNLVWESAHLPLYTIWTTGTLGEQVFAVVHCTLGDLLIGLSTLILALIAVGHHGWPHDRFWRVAGLTIALGVGYTAISEWLNVVARASWAYSEWMPVLSVLGMRVGLSPLLQWMVLPAAAFMIVRRLTRGENPCISLAKK